MNILVEAKMAVASVAQSVKAPGETTVASESISLQAAAPIASKSVPNGMAQLGIMDPAMMGKLELGKTYRILIIEDDAG